MLGMKTNINTIDIGPDILNCITIQEKQQATAKAAKAMHHKKLSRKHK